MVFRPINNYSIVHYTIEYENYKRRYITLSWICEISCRDLYSFSCLDFELRLGLLLASWHQ